MWREPAICGDGLSNGFGRPQAVAGAAVRSRRENRRVTEALAQIPGSPAAKILVRVDGAGATHVLLEHLEALNTIRRTVRYTVGRKITEDDEQAIARLPETA